jgi:hypothetical protein
LLSRSRCRPQRNLAAAASAAVVGHNAHRAKNATRPSNGCAPPARGSACPLFSPPHTPEYNGAREAGIGALKTRIHEQAALAGHSGRWTADDTEAARRMANELHYPWGWQQPTPARLWQARPTLTREQRATFRQTVNEHRNTVQTQQGYPLNDDLDHYDQAAIDRVAIRRALVELGFLTFTRRSITPPLPTRKPLRIS